MGNPYTQNAIPPVERAARDTIGILEYRGPYVPPPKSSPDELERKSIPTLRDELDRADLEQHINTVFAGVDRLKAAMRLTPHLVTEEDLTFLAKAHVLLGQAIVLSEFQKALGAYMSPIGILLIQNATQDAAE